MDIYAGKILNCCDVCFSKLYVPSHRAKAFSLKSWSVQYCFSVLVDSWIFIRQCREAVRCLKCIAGFLLFLLLIEHHALLLIFGVTVVYSRGFVFSLCLNLLTKKCGLCLNIFFIFLLCSPGTVTMVIHHLPFYDRLKLWFSLSCSYAS